MFAWTLHRTFEMGNETQQTWRCAGCPWQHCLTLPARFARPCHCLREKDLK